LVTLVIVGRSSVVVSVITKDLRSHGVARRSGLALYRPGVVPMRAAKAAMKLLGFARPQAYAT
jgi:hypothetical protein